MESLYDTLLSLNRIEGAFETWREYRRGLTDFILESSVQSGTLLIVGAGACNDLDLQKLNAFFSAVTLLDRDAHALNEAVKRYPRCNIQLHQADLLGIPDDAYRAFAEDAISLIRNKADCAMLTETFINEMESLVKNAHPDTLPQADTIVCCGVHSQVLTVFARMATVLSRYGNLDLKAVYKAVSHQNSAWQPIFNQRLAESANSNLILGLERERVGFPGGIEGTAQALWDIEKNRSVACQTELTWPFDPKQGKIYRVSVLSVPTDSI